MLLPHLAARRVNRWFDWHVHDLLLLCLLVPPLILVILRVFPSLDLPLQDHWFHFQIVSFTCLIAFMSGITATILTGASPDSRSLFATVALGALAGIFLLHGLATPGVLAPSADHAEHGIAVQLFARPDLTITWSAPISLMACAVFLALAAWNWSAAMQARLFRYRRPILLVIILGYLSYVGIVMFAPAPLEFLASLSPITRYGLALLAGVLYLFAAYRFYQDYRTSQRRFDAALAAAALLLAQALIPLLFMPIWNLSWWLYHILMLVAFCIALGAVIVEYEHAGHFRMTSYFAVTGIVVIALLAVLIGELVTLALPALGISDPMNIARAGTMGLFIVMATILFIALLQIVRRADQLLTERTQQLQKQEAALERGRLAEALVPIGVAMGSELNLDRVLDLICIESLHLFQVDTSLLWFKEDDELVARTAFGRHRNGFIGMRQPVPNNPLLGARVVRERKPLLVNNAQKGVGVSRALVEQFEIKSIMGVPLVSQDQVLGSLVLIDSRNPEHFGELDLEIARIFGQQAAMVLTHARLYDQTQHQAQALAATLADLRASYQATLTALSAALDARDRETEGHSRRVTAYSLLLARALNVTDAATLGAIEWGALLHDIGKIGVPDAILHKPGALNEDEWKQMRRHPEIGSQIIENIPFLTPALAIVRSHHEKWDGSGYPCGLAREAIPLPARVFAVADTLDAMTTDRPYRQGRRFADARVEIMQCKGNQFDPTIVDTFLIISEEQWRAAAEQVTLFDSAFPDGRGQVPTTPRAKNVVKPPPPRFRSQTS